MRTSEPTETIAKFAPKLNMGLFALLCGFLHVEGARAPAARFAPTLALRAAFARLGRVCHGRPRGPPIRPLQIAALIAGIMALTTTSASAATVHAYTSSFGSGPCVVEPLERCEGKFDEPSGVAVNDTTGDVYVVDKGNKRVEQFAFDATTKAYDYMGQFAPPAGFSNPEAIAVDNSGSGVDSSKEDVYVTDVGDSVIDQFTASGTYVGRLTGTCEKIEIGEVPPACPGVGNKFVPFAPESEGRGLKGVAVDPAGNVWVYENSGPPVKGVVDEFSDTGSFVKTFRTERGALPPGLAVDSSDDVYLRSGLGQVRKFEAATGAEIAEFSEDATALAIDPEATNEDVFVFQTNPANGSGSISEYEPGGGGLVEPPFTATGLSESRGIAVNNANTVFAAQGGADSVEVFDEDPLPEVSTEAGVSNLAAYAATLNGTVNPAGDELASCEFEYVAASEYEPAAANPYAKGAKVACAPAAASIPATEETAVTANLAGLSPDTTYHYRLVVRNVDNLTGETSDRELTTKGAGIGEEQATGIEASAATLQAQIDPNESNTTAVFEYDTSPYGEGEAPHGTRVPARTDDGQEIGAGTSPVFVSARLTGLEPGRTYYYRVVATDEIETFDGPGEAFTTSVPASVTTETCPNAQLRAEQPFGLTLPDCRAYEMVSPLQTEGQDATDSFVNTRPRAAVSGEAVTYTSRGSFAGAAGSNIEDQFLSRRNVKEKRWETQAITPPWNPTKAEAHPSYPATVFTPELTQGIASTNAQLTGEASGEFGMYQADFSSGSYRYVGEGAFPQGASTDLSHVVVGSDEWVEGRVVPVTVANDGKGLQASVGSQEYYATGYENELWHAVSGDGSRVYFTSPGKEYGNPTPGQLYLRENAEQEQSPTETNAKGEEVCENSADACTVEVSASQRLRANPAGVQTAHYRGASADGSKVFFTSNAELTEDAYTGSDGQAANLYEYDLDRPASERLKDLTGEATDKTGNGAAVRGVVQISEDGSYVYFVAEGALTVEANAQGARAATGQPNLYVSHEGGPPRFIVTLAAGGPLAGGDSEDWDGPARSGGSRAAQEHQTIEEEDARENASGPASNSAVMSPDGTRLAFTSFRKLTAYDNDLAEGPYRQTCEREAVREQQEGFAPPFRSCQAANEVYLYDVGSGGLVCASCNPSGARPLGPSSFGKFDHFSVVQYQARNLLEDGTLFFDSDDALVPHSSDARQNVYEYEDGEIHAISDVAGGYESFFIDAGANGANVFFGSADRLLPQDTSENVVVWDARVDGGFPAPVAPPSCDNADSCKPPASGGRESNQSVFGAPASATFSGPGDQTPAIVPPPPKKTTVKKTVKCKRGFVKKKNKCVKKTKAKKAKRAGNDRRAH